MLPSATQKNSGRNKTIENAQTLSFMHIVLQQRTQLECIQNIIQQKNVTEKTDSSTSRGEVEET